MADQKRTEEILHDAYWGIQREVGAAERAIVEARDVMYAVLTDSAVAKGMVVRWLDRYGHDELREGGDMPQFGSFEAYTKWESAQEVRS